MSEEPEEMDLSAKYALIRECVKAKRSMTCQYAGLERVFSPHMLGYMGTSMMVFVYQFSGDSWSDEIIHKSSPKNWRNYALSEIRELKPLLTQAGNPSKRWLTHSSYTGNSRGWTEVAVQVPAAES